MAWQQSKLVHPTTFLALVWTPLGTYFFGSVDKSCSMVRSLSRGSGVDPKWNYWVSVGWCSNGLQQGCGPVRGAEERWRVSVSWYGIPRLFVPGALCCGSTWRVMCQQRDDWWRPFASLDGNPVVWTAESSMQGRCVFQLEISLFLAITTMNI